MVKVKLSKGAKELTRGSEFSTGFDLQAIGYKRVIKKDGKNSLADEVVLFDNEEITIRPMERILITTGVQIQPEDAIRSEEGDLYITDVQIRNRSGLTLKDGILCQLGTIDLDYRNDLGLSIINLSDEDFKIKKYDRLAQLCFVFAGIPTIEYVDKLSETARATNGFGSTGK